MSDFVNELAILYVKNHCDKDTSPAEMLEIYLSACDEIREHHRDIKEEKLNSY